MSGKIFRAVSAAMKISNLTTRHLLILTAFVLINTLPFCQRAYHLDEYFYIKGAMGVSAKPLFPQDFPMVWFGTEYPTAGFHSHPPLLVYTLWLIMKVFGSTREIYLHLAFLVFSLAAAASTYFLARRFTKYPLMATLIVLASPASLVMSQTVMSDMVFQAFLMTAFACYLSGLERDRAGRMALSSLLMMLACFTSYQGLFFILLLPFYAWLSGRWNPRLMVYSAPPYLFLGVWLIMGYFHYSIVPPLGGMPWYEKYLLHAKVLIDNGVATATFIGGVCVFPLTALLLLRGAKLWRVGLAAAAAALLAVCFGAGYSLTNKILFWTLAANGIGLLALVASQWRRSLLSARAGKRSPKQTRDLFLGTWFAGVLLFYIVSAEAVRARFLLVLIPPLVFFIVNFIDEDLPYHAPYRRVALPLLFALTWMTALPIAVSDYQFVVNYREFADYFDRTYGAFPAGKWGAVESGLRFYMEQVGLNVLSENDDSPRSMDLIVRPERIFKYEVAQDLEPELSLIEQKALDAGLPLRTLPLHDSKFFLLPYYLSRRPPDVINIYQVNMALHNLPEAEIRGVLRARALPTPWTLDGQTRTVIRQPVNSTISYPLTLPPEAALAFFFASDSTTQAATAKGERELRVILAKEGEEAETLFRQRLAAGDGSAGRHWQAVILDVTPYARQKVRLALEVYAKPGVEPGADVGWADLVIGPAQVLQARKPNSK